MRNCLKKVLLLTFFSFYILSIASGEKGSDAGKVIKVKPTSSDTAQLVDIINSNYGLIDQYFVALELNIKKVFIEYENMTKNSKEKYPDIDKKAKSIEVMLKDIKKRQKNLDNIVSSCNRILKLNPGISSSDDEWNDLIDLYTDFNLSIKELESDSSKLGQKVNNFIGLLNKHVVSNIKTVNVMDLKNQIETSYDKTLNNVSLIEKDCEKVFLIYADIISFVSDMSVKPYPELKDKIATIKGIMSDIKHGLKEMNSLVVLYNRITKGRKKIASDDSIFYEIEELLKEYEVHSHKIKSGSAKINKENITFIGILKKYKIAKIQLDKDELEKSLKNLDHSIKDLEKAMADFKKDINKMKKSGGNSKDNSRREDVYSQALNNLSDIKKKRDNFSSLINKLLKINAKNNQIYSGPGIKTDKIIEEMQSVSKDIQKIGLKLKKIK